MWQEAACLHKLRGSREPPLARRQWEASACSARPPAVLASPPPPQPALDVWEEQGGGYFLGPQLGAGWGYSWASLPPQHPLGASSSQAPPCPCPGEASSSPWQCAVLSAGVHTPGRQRDTGMCVEADADTGTNISSLRNVRALGRSYLCQCARVQRNQHGQTRT